MNSENLYLLEVRWLKCTTVSFSASPFTIKLFNKCVLHTYEIPGTILDAKDSVCPGGGALERRQTQKHVDNQVTDRIYKVDVIVTFMCQPGWPQCPDN